MNALMDFLAMGGYAVYVWGSYAVTFVFMALEIVAVVRRRRALLQRRQRPRHSVSEGYV